MKHSDYCRKFLTQENKTTIAMSYGIDNILTDYTRKTQIRVRSPGRASGYDNCVDGRKRVIVTIQLGLCQS